jgi:hypothetical protein
MLHALQIHAPPFATISVRPIFENLRIFDFFGQGFTEILGTTLRIQWIWQNPTVGAPIA